MTNKKQLTIVTIIAVIAIFISLFISGCRKDYNELREGDIVIYCTDYTKIGVIIDTAEIECKVRFVSENGFHEDWINYFELIKKSDMDQVDFLIKMGIHTLEELKNQKYGTK